MEPYFPTQRASALSAPVAARHHLPGKLLRLDAEFAEACRRGDGDWLQRHLAEDFRCVGGDGARFTRSEFIALRGGPVAMPMVPGDADVQFEGETAIVQSVAATAAARERVLDIWIGRDGRWQLLATQRTAITGPDA